MKRMEAKSLKVFLKKMQTELDGDWVIIGGALLPLLGRNYRVTLDVDIVALDGDTTDRSLQLMELAEQIGWPIETINQAGPFFLRKIKGFEQKLIPFSATKNGHIYRPSFELYLELKLGRFSESDHADCVEYAKWHFDCDEVLDQKKAVALLKKFQKKEQSATKKARMAELEEFLTQMHQRYQVPFHSGPG